METGTVQNEKYRNVDWSKYSKNTQLVKPVVNSNPTVSGKYGDVDWNKYLQIEKSSNEPKLKALNDSRTFSAPTDTSKSYIDSLFAAREAERQQKYGEPIGPDNGVGPTTANVRGLLDGYKPSVQQQNLNVAGIGPDEIPVYPEQTVSASPSKIPLKDIPLSDQQRKIGMKIPLPKQEDVYANERARLDAALKAIQSFTTEPLQRVTAPIVEGERQIGQAFAEDNTPGSELRRWGNLLSGGVKIGLGVLPPVAALNAIQPVIGASARKIGETIGVNPDDAENVANKITPFVFGLPVGIGSLAGDEGAKLLDKSGALNGLKEEDKKLALDLVQNGLFFGIAALGGKGIEQGKERVKNKFAPNDQRTSPSVNPQKFADVVKNGKDLKSVGTLNERPTIETQQPTIPDDRPSVTVMADPQSRLIVNDLEKFVDGAIKRNSLINEASITSRINDVTDPIEQQRLGELYTKVLEHNKNSRSVETQGQSIPITGATQEQFENLSPTDKPGDVEIENVEKNSPQSQPIENIEHLPLQPKDSIAQPETSTDIVDNNKALAFDMMKRGEGYSAIMRITGLPMNKESMRLYHDWRKEFDRIEKRSEELKTQPIPTEETQVANAFQGNEDDSSLITHIAQKLLGDESFNHSVEKLNNFTSYFNKNKIKDTYQNIMGYIDGLKGKTLPRTTRVNQAAGEAGARYISARYAADFLAKDMSERILNNEADPNLIGAILTEDNLRSVKKKFLDEGNKDVANNVKTLVGDKGYFKNEDEYQKYLNDPTVQDVINRYREIFVNDRMDKLYKKAQDIIPDEELPSRGLQTDARINLLVVHKDSKTPKSKTASATRSPDQLGTMKKDSPFAREAKGNAESYNINMHDIIANTYGKQLEAATYKDFLNELVKNGLAKIDKPGMRVELSGKKTVAFPIQRKSLVITNDGKFITIPQNENVYVRGDLAREFRIAANLDSPTRGIVLQKVNQAFNYAALQGLTDATAHAANLTSALLSRPGIGGDIIREGIASTGGIGDFGIAVERMVKKAIDMHNDTPGIKKQLAELSSIGALRQGIHGGVMGRFLLRYDTTTRLVMDDAYNFLVKKGLAENSETARREFINQVGQYNRRAQGPIMRTLKDLGISPFITAGKTFANLAVKNVTADPGVKATSLNSAAALKGLTASRFAGTIGTIMLTNYLLTQNKGGGIFGRPGTPLLSIDTGKDDKQGKPIIVNAVGKLFGYDRALRSTGIKGFVESKMHGLNNTQAIHSSLRDVINTTVGMVAGPPVRFAVGAATGYPTAIDMNRQFPIVAPGSSQKLSDLKNSLLASNPLSETYRQIQEKGTDFPKALQIGLEKQLPGFTPRAGLNPDTEAKLPEIVDRRELKDYIDFVAKETYRLPTEERREFLLKKLAEIPDSLRGRAIFELRQKGF